ncbi:MAG: tRNA (adenosine(37)-N6)-dimethylallyltransferase MiaA [Bacteroidia bacterium]|nr:MAG: tRNA (adenosine(37)-N6)-dimethylallyltransferase MiaA [Bacteroidia bacterium]
MSKPILPVITGPTASGKTIVAAHVASTLNGEVISADSRQVYRGMDLGTGKDLDDFIVDGKQVPYHLIDIAEPGYEYNVYEYQQDFSRAFADIAGRKKQAVLCGGTGLYVEAAIKGYRMKKVPEDPVLRAKLSQLPMETLTAMLSKLRPPHNITDTGDRKRLIRAIEIAVYENEHMHEVQNYPVFLPVVFAIAYPRNVIRERITRRLEQRLAEGMIDEVKKLLSSGIKPEQLSFYGLEYRYLTQYVNGQISYSEMFNALNTAIHQFAKRQMTWFRRMEKKGTKIHWIEGKLSLEEKVDIILHFKSLAKK